jgi:hypothetical protein
MLSFTPEKAGQVTGLVEQGYHEKSRQQAIEENGALDGHELFS